MKLFIIYFPFPFLKIFPYPIAENKINIVQEGGLPPLVLALQTSNERVQKQAAGAIRNLSTIGE